MYFIIWYYVLYVHVYYTYMHNVYNICLSTDVPSNILHRVIHFYLIITYIRCRYYFVWCLNDSISNTAGLGFKGYDSDNNPKWDGASNIDIVKMESAMNIRTSINTWNATTAHWLRRYIHVHVHLYVLYCTVLCVYDILYLYMYMYIQCTIHV